MPNGNSEMETDLIFKHLLGVVVLRSASIPAAVLPRGEMPTAFELRMRIATNP